MDLRKKAPKVSSTTVVSLVLIATISASAIACRPPGPGPVIGTAVVDCTTANRDKIDALIGEFAPLLMQGQANWSVIYQRAKQAGATIGGCFLGEMINAYLGGIRFAKGAEPPSPEVGWEARAYFELFRQEELNNATLKTSDGNL